MSFTRLNYDSCTYKHNLKQSIGTADYQINTPKQECHGCFPADPSLNIDGYGASICRNKPLIDVDSELKIITRRASNCPTQKYLPTPGQFCETKNLPDCRSLPQEDTRISNPPCTLRSTGINRWEWLCQNPQAKALMPFDFNISNRIIVKDNHRPCIPRPLSVAPLLPPNNNSNETFEYKHICTEESSEFMPSIHWRKATDYKNYINAY